MAQRKRFRIEASDIPAPVVPGLEYRRLDAPADYRRMNEIANAVRPMAFALDQLCTGNLRGMFDGPTTPGLDLDAPHADDTFDGARSTGR